MHWRGGYPPSHNCRLVSTRDLAIVSYLPIGNSMVNAFETKSKCPLVYKLTIHAMYKARKTCFEVILLNVSSFEVILPKCNIVYIDKTRSNSSHLQCVALVRPNFQFLSCFVMNNLESLLTVVFNNSFNILFWVIIEILVLKNILNEHVAILNINVSKKNKWRYVIKVSVIK